MTRWILRRFDRVDPEARRRAAVWVLLASLVGWPASALTVARGEPQFILGLSWLAVAYTAVDVLSTTDVRAQQEETGETG